MCADLCFRAPEEQHTAVVGSCWVYCFENNCMDPYLSHKSAICQALDNEFKFTCIRAQKACLGPGSLFFIVKYGGSSVLLASSLNCREKIIFLCSSDFS